LPLTMSDRQHVVDHLHELADAPSAELLAFLAEREEAVLDEAGALPGIDQVRAAILRAWTRAEHPRLDQAVANAIGALDAYESELAEGSPVLLQRRHPAWVGLAGLEAGLPLDRAVAYASTGFRSVAGPHAEGDVLWAMAEAAEDAGWSDRHALLLEAAQAADFLDPAPQAQVRLLWALHRIEDDPAAAGELDALFHDVEAPDATRVHAAWILAVRAREGNDAASARQHLIGALALVDEEEEPEVAQRIREALGA
jgi:hypothetical protein